MKGLSVLKDTPDPIALPDAEYPAWLWTLTDAAKAAEERAVGAGENKSEVDKSGFDFKAERRKLRQS
jgi:large subunit ribosomal protein L54